MVGPSRTMGKAFIERRMIDTCSVDRDIKGVFDAVLNEATGELESNISDSNIYTGKCLIAMINSRDKEILSAEMPFSFNVYSALLPRNANSTAIRIGDILTITESGNDPTMVGNAYRVKHAEQATHPLYTRILIEDKAESLGTPTI